MVGGRCPYFLIECLCYADRAGCNIVINDVFEPLASEMLVDGFVGAVDTWMIEVSMIPSDDRSY